MTSRSTFSLRRWRWLSIVAAANLAAVGLVAAPSQAQGASLCSGTAENFTIVGNLAVPAGASCTLINSRVTGNVVVRAEANLGLEGSTVDGDLTAHAASFVDLIGGTVRGTTRLRDAFGGVVESSDVQQVSVAGSGFLITDRSTHGASLVSQGSQTVVLSGRINGDVRTSGDVLTDLHDSVITGRLVVDQAELGSVTCRSEIDANVTVRGSADLVQLGEGTFADCEFNVLGGDLVLQDNLGAIEVNGNVIRGDLGCDGNESAPTGAGNRVRGQQLGQCADLAAAAPALGSSRAATSAEDRIAGLIDGAADRSAAAAAAAERAGPANL
ncbi:MAG: hypothetical protein GEV12_02205 [Micromonosporaceae bacterium]|nr:hypothetical protein [Micromonosporaceae bacterium]